VQQYISPVAPSSPIRIASPSGTTSATSATSTLKPASRSLSQRSRDRTFVRDLPDRTLSEVVSTIKHLSVRHLSVRLRCRGALGSSSRRHAARVRDRIPVRHLSSLAHRLSMVPPMQDDSWPLVRRAVKVRDSCGKAQYRRTQSPRAACSAGQSPCHDTSEYVNRIDTDESSGRITPLLAWCETGYATRSSA
jgi:hypothetical protein